MLRPALLTVIVWTFALPALTAWILWRGKGESASAVVMRGAASLLGLVVFLVVCNWSLVAVWVAPLLGLACVPFALRALRRASRLPFFLPLTPRRAASYVSSAGLLALFGFLACSALGGAYSERTIDLQFPLSEPWYVLHGGVNPIMNPHRSARAQSYALDILGLNAWGARASGVLPDDLGRYAIFGDPVHAPCAGEVLTVEDGHADRTPPERDADNLAGNHLTMICGDATVLLAHLRQGSVLPRAGDRVETGQLIARAGNSGNTSEPHLHVHAVRGRVSEREELLFTGTPVPMRFQGLLLRRHSSSFWRWLER